MAQSFLTKLTRCVAACQCDLICVQRSRCPDCHYNTAAYDRHYPRAQAKNFVPGAEGKSTKVSATVLALQEQLPKARIVYCSATGVSELLNLALAVVCEHQPKRAGTESLYKHLLYNRQISQRW
jgi:P-loop containing NTP hydrolase pore-1